MRDMWELTSRFVQIGFFSIGGGYAAIPLIQEHVVQETGWLEIDEYMDIIAISQMTPGPLAVNVSTFVGMRLGGMTGAVAATFGCVISGLIISFVLRAFFRAASGNPVAAAVLEALKAASVGLIACSAATIGVQALFAAPGASFDLAAATLFIAVLFALRKWRASPTLLLLLAGLIGIVAHL